MKIQIVLPLLISFVLFGCGFSSWDEFMGNPKHVCDYNGYASATVQNSASQTVSVYFCSDSAEQQTLRMGGPVANDRAAHDFNVLIEHKHDEYNDSAPETCGIKGIPSGNAHFKGYYASLAPADLANSQLCLNHQGDKFDSTTYKTDPELFVVVDRAASCPIGFLPYDQSANPCTPAQ